MLEVVVSSNLYTNQIVCLKSSNLNSFQNGTTPLVSVETEMTD